MPNRRRTGIFVYAYTFAPCGAWCYRFNSGRVCRRPMDQRGKGPPSDCREYTRRLRQMPGEDRKEHTSELQSLMRISYAVFCLKKKQQHTFITYTTQNNHTPRETTPQHKQNATYHKHIRS